VEYYSRCRGEPATNSFVTTDIDGGVLADRMLVL